ncbi:hypothetical protein Prudu_007337 [Prunus dulcis]|uniref:Uncharacterized protein n=1 Tax=Prunus dulcis TaxID=3755 RepID=A0A4Y1R1Q3_PRUDU|nr:hypothetical protein Prudu_007337 [Prunus dulcis]
MTSPGNQDLHTNDEIDGVDRIADQSNGEELENSSSSNGAESSGVGPASRSEIGLEERLTDILVDEGDGDLLLQQSNREDRVMGACRADERLKPLLKKNASNDVAEGRLLAQLSQHFEPAEVGMLARCFCIPLVSIRVGKINKQGTLLCPTAARYLKHSLLWLDEWEWECGTSPYSEHGTVKNYKQEWWMFGITSLSMGNLNLTVLPTSNLRLSFVGDDGRTDRLFTLSSKSQCSAVEVNEIPTDNSGRSFLTKIPGGRVFYFWCSETSRLLGIELLAKATKANSSFQGSLSPRPSSFKEGLPRTLSSLRNISREKLRRRGDMYLSGIDIPTIASSITVDASCPNNAEIDKRPEVIRSFLESLGKLAVPSTLNPASQVPYIVHQICSSQPELPELPVSSIESALLPPLSSLLQANVPSSMLTTKPPLNLADAPLVDFPAFLPDPLVRLPRPTSQQIPTFTPLMCDPIVHIPVIDICSSGQGYLVSAGPAISTAISPLHPKLVSIPETDSMVEKGARETLRRLLMSGSTESGSQLIDVLPAMLSNAHENRNLLVGGAWVCIVETGTLMRRDPVDWMDLVRKIRVPFVRILG